MRRHTHQGCYRPSRCQPQSQGSGRRFCGGRGGKSPPGERGGRQQLLAAPPLCKPPTTGDAHTTLFDGRDSSSCDIVDQDACGVCQTAFVIMLPACDLALDAGDGGGCRWLRCHPYNYCSRHCSIPVAQVPSWSCHSSHCQQPRVSHTLHICYSGCKGQSR
jgi:hypothetical protein